MRRLEGGRLLSLTLEPPTDASEAALHWRMEALFSSLFYQPNGALGEGAALVRADGAVQFESAFGCHVLSRQTDGTLREQNVKSGAQQWGSTLESLFTRGDTRALSEGVVATHACPALELTPSV